eukprot:1817868-Prymnesium_polylepis.1
MFVRGPRRIELRGEVRDGQPVAGPCSQKRETKPMATYMAVVSKVSSTPSPTNCNGQRDLYYINGCMTARQASPHRPSMRHT